MFSAVMPSGLISVIVTTYNREDALDAVLRSLALQNDTDFEVIVADDGSRAATATTVEAWKGKVGRRLDYVWHDDRGFRAAEIRNRAILASRGVYCIFLDGDCITRPDFVATHRRLAEHGCFVTGNRILLSRGADGQSAARQTCAGNLDRGALARRTPARRRQPAVGAAASAARAAAPAAQKRLARRAFLQPRHLARRSRSRRRLRWRLQRLGQGGFRHHRAAAACRRCAARTACSPPASCICGTPITAAIASSRTNASCRTVSRSDRVRARRGLSALQGAPSPALAG